MPRSGLRLAWWGAPMTRLQTYAFVAFIGFVSAAIVIAGAWLGEGLS